MPKCGVEAVNLHVYNLCLICSEQVSVYVCILLHICAYMHQGIFFTHMVTLHIWTNGVQKRVCLTHFSRR
jgi:hypothetical protein